MDKSIRENLHSITPARILGPRHGTGLSTKAMLQLRADHAFARDAVFQSVLLQRDFRSERIDQLGLFELFTKAIDRQQYLLHPELGRQLRPQDRELLLKQCPPRPRLQIVLGDGLSATALVQQGPPLLDALWEMAGKQKLALGRPFLVHQARVGILNEIGNLLEPDVVVLLIGERPGLGTAESLSAYMAYRPNHGDTDASRNLISNIHSRGVGIEEAATRILALVESMLAGKVSGTAIKERLALPGIANPS